MPANPINSHFMHRGFLVQAYPDRPCRTDILERINKLFGHAISTHGRVLFVRFDLTFPENLVYLGDNTVLQRFLDSLQHHCGRAGMASHYLWVREHNASRPNHHYHLVFLLGGDIPKSCRPILRQAEKHWALALGLHSGSGLVDYCNRPDPEYPLGNGIVLDRACSDYPSMLRYCYHWASYLAKTSTKGNRPMGVREFGSSRLPSDSTFSAP